jgi:ADP-ribose pyrophosphatase YjhB (NUDIX family)
MMMRDHGHVPIRCVGAVISDPEGRLLLVRRANDPGRGLWSLPGGRVEAGESDEVAVVREVREETGLDVVAGRLVGRIRLRNPDGEDYDVGDYICTVTGGRLAAATDALDAAVLDPRTVTTTQDLAEILTRWGVLAPRVDGTVEG